MEYIKLKNRLEPLWDDYLVDEARSTAEKRLNRPVDRGPVLVYDEPWEGDGCNYNNFVTEPDGLIRMYYLAWEMLSYDRSRHTMENIKVCYAETRDGVNWVKPKLGICDFDGSKENNIIVSAEFDGPLDNWYVFRDDKPGVPDSERYKAIYAHNAAATGATLRCALSDDGIHFRKGWDVTNKGYFDSLNTAHWNAELGKYLAYVRGFHDVIGDDLNSGVRDVSVMESEDFRVWSDPVRLDFRGGDDYPLYTNAVSPYYRAPHILTGFPTRYVERLDWSDSFDKIPGAESRRTRYKISKRYGLTVTDCVFMCSRDGYAWSREESAFLRPGPENGLNWVYGDAYPAVGTVETPSPVPGAEPQTAMFSYLGHWSGRPAMLMMHTLRRDGFVSRSAGYDERELVTKPFVCDSKSLSLNFSTSARGYVAVEILDKNLFPIAGLSSGELFGDATDREVKFGADLQRVKGMPVRIRMRLRDADVYAIRLG